MQSVSSRIWTRVAVFISYDDNDYTTGTSKNARPWWNTWFLVQKIHPHSRQTSTRNEQMPPKCTHTRMDDQRKDHIDPKGPKQKNRPPPKKKNYRPITFLWKILTLQMREEINHSQTSRGLFPEEQKECHKGSRGTAELLYMDQHILNESKKRQKDLAMAWIDYKKAYDMVPQS